MTEPRYVELLLFEPGYHVGHRKWDWGEGWRPQRAAETEPDFVDWHRHRGPIFGPGVETLPVGREKG
jgi:hypothetical protein